MSYTLYTKEYGKYDFPSNLSQSQMIDHINKWKMMVPLEDQKYYEAAINIIQGKESQSFTDELGKGGSINPSFLAESVVTVYEPHKVGHDALHYYQQTGQVPQMNLYSQNVGNPNINRTGAQEQQRRKEIVQLDTLLDTISNIIGKMRSQRNMNAYLDEYDRYSKQFIHSHERFIKRYQIYWYEDDKDKHRTKVQEIRTMCNGFGQYGSVFDELFNQLSYCFIPYSNNII